jgi:phage gpG-like protein
MDMEFKINGLDDLNEALTQIVSQFPDQELKELMRLGYIVEGEIKPLVPVQTGALRASVTTQPIDQHNVEVGTNAEYAQAVNDGHVQNRRFLPAEYMQDCPNDKGVMLQEKFIEGTHFMENGLQSAETKAQQELETFVQKMLNDLSK